MFYVNWVKRLPERYLEDVKENPYDHLLLLIPLVGTLALYKAMLETNVKAANDIDQWLDGFFDPES